MKTKLLALIILFTTLLQAQVSDFVTGLDAPNRLIIDNEIIYVKGVAAGGSIHQINLSDATPTANVLFTLPTTGEALGIGSIVKDGSIIYLSYYDDSTGESTLAHFNINSPTILNTMVSGLGFVPAIALYSDELYFTDESLSGAGVSLKKISTTNTNPPIITVVSGFTNPQDMEFKNNVLYVGDRDANTIYAVDVNATVPTLIPFITNVNVRGIYVYSDFLFYSEGVSIKKAPFSNPTNSTVVAVDNSSNSEFLRDVVISGINLYMPQEDSNKIVTTQDGTLSSDDFNLISDTISIYNDKNNLSFRGLTERNLEVAVSDINGKQLIHRRVNSDNNSVDISVFSNGIYLVTLENGNTFKFVK